MPDLRDIWTKDWHQLPQWTGLHTDDPDGTQYRGEYRGQTYIVTVNRREDGSAYSTSEEVRVV